VNDRLTTERRYQSGFGNEYASEAVAGALPQGRNSPQRAPFDLYPELISGTAFTAPRHENRRSWMCRRQPSVVPAQFRLPELGPIGSDSLANARDFQAPVAAFESEAGGYEIVKKLAGRFWRAPMMQSPFNVVAWHGNLAPVKERCDHEHPLP
jgi:homogentisate 1,2-dioxygenase